MPKMTALFACVLLLGGHASADEKKPQPLSTTQAADAVLQAAQAKDQAALKALAEKEPPDPWLVADELCGRGAYDAAQLFAKAAPRRDIEHLPAYVAAARTRKPDAEKRMLLVALLAAQAAGKFQEILAQTSELAAPAQTVLSIRLHALRGAALHKLRRFQESPPVFTRAAEAAAKLGWLRQAAALYHYAGLGSYLSSAWSQTLDAWNKRLEFEERRGDTLGVAKTLNNLGNIYMHTGNYPEALSTLQRALAIKEELGDRRSAAKTIGDIGLIYAGLGQHAKALATYERALAQKRALGDRRGAANTLVNLGNAHATMGNFAGARASLEQALKEMHALGNRRGAASALGSLAGVQLNEGDPAKALATYEKLLVEMKALGNRAGVATVLTNMGIAQRNLGEHTEALASFSLALQQQQALGDKRGAALTRANLGRLYEIRGDFSKALSVYESALAQHRKLGNLRGAAATLGFIGNVHYRLGDDARALATYKQAHAEHAALKDRVEAAKMLANVGIVQRGLGEHAKARASYERALAEQTAVGDTRGMARTQGYLAGILEKQGEFDKSLDIQARVLAERDARKDRLGAAWTRMHMGTTHTRKGDYGKARTYIEQSVRDARDLRATPLIVLALRSLAWVELLAGDPAQALRTARQALGLTEKLLGGLGDEQGAVARGEYASLYAIGALAAVDDGNAAEVVKFLESGRAGALLDALDKREVLRWKADALTPALRTADREAWAAVHAAQKHYEHVVARGATRQELRVAAKSLDDANATVSDVTGRIQRELKQQAGLFYPVAKSVEEIRSSLAKDQALVLYGLCLDHAIALVMRRETERVVKLGKAAEIVAACESLDAADVGLDPRGALDTLRKRLVEPLGLGKDVRQVLVSPDGALCYLPWGALFEQAVAATPSGTTHMFLLDEEHSAGSKVLALGDPDYETKADATAVSVYRGGTLAPLPATRDEVQAVGDVVLLGKDANESKLREALAKEKRWRAVHLACHGLVKPAKPMMSSLALTTAGDHDGFLTGAEVMRMEIPADLAVLSACQTATGKLLRSEGIMGLTRAFMFAGAPRIICSLWKVDDEATKALMIKFYELWNPSDGEQGLGAALALKKAQEHVRDFKDADGKQRWKHPYYWAAWTLWGLPE